MADRKVRSPNKVSKRPYWISRKDQIECLASAVRIDIVDHLAGGGPMSIKEIAREIGKKPSALYHHFEMLEDVDLIFEAGSRLVNRKTEKVYATPSRKMRMLKALGDPAHAEEMRAIVGSLARRLDKEFARGLDNDRRKTEGPARNLGFYRFLNRPSKSTLKEVNAKLDEIAELLWQDRDPSQPMVLLSWVMSPVDSD